MKYGSDNVLKVGNSIFVGKLVCVLGRDCNTLPALGLS